MRAVLAGHGGDDFFATVYEGSEGPVASKRWEVAREGIEDYEYLYLLRQSIDDAKARGVSGERLADARALLAEIPVEMADVLLQAGRRLPLTPDSVPVYEEVTRRVDDARARIVAMCFDVARRSTPLYSKAERNCVAQASRLQFQMQARTPALHRRCCQFLLASAARNQKRVRSA